MNKHDRQRDLGQASRVDVGRRLREAGFVFGVALATFFLVALIGYDPSDPGWSQSSSTLFVHNIEGLSGAIVADVSLFSCGVVAYILPLVIVQLAWVFTRGRDPQRPRFSDGLAAIGVIAFIVSASALASIHLPDHRLLPAGAGGVLGQSLAWRMLPLFGVFGSSLILGACFVVSISLAGTLSWAGILLQLRQYTWTLASWIHRCAGVMVNQLRATALAVKQQLGALRLPERKPKTTIQPTVPDMIKSNPPKPVATLSKDEQPRVVPHIVANVGPALVEEADALDSATIVSAVKHTYLPPFSLLDPVQKKVEVALNETMLQEISENVRARLKDFGVDAKVVAVQPGPVITRYELQLAPGTKVSKIVGLAKDLARSLSVPSVRVVEVIPGKSVIGLELPNEAREMVQLREVLDSNAYASAKSGLSLALGKDIGGHSVVVDLAKMPHLLVAGTTGSGKSVSLNAMLLSLLYKSTPDQLRLIMIDPKMLELAIYDGIPHLLTPVVTDMRDAANALRWCVAEMERRYALMAAMKVRNIGGYNRKIQDAKKAGKIVHDPTWAAQTGEAPPELDELPQIMVLVDEFADLMMVVGKKLEQLIARLAQKARAAGIHLILATQRPSVDVITGLIKANIPTRIAFQVSSRIDSRTILDQQGAEQLLGHGDMLYLPAGAGVPVRVHGAFVADDEVNRVVDAIKKRREPQYVDGITGGMDSGGGVQLAVPGLDGGFEDSEQDALYDQAVKIVTETRRASISNIQRRLKIGYNRAARLIEAMEAAGLVSAMESNGNREVLVPVREEQE